MSYNAFTINNILTVQQNDENYQHIGILLSYSYLVNKLA